MLRILAVFSAVCLFASVLFAEEWIGLNDAPEVYTVEVLKSDNLSTILHYGVNRYKTGRVSIAGKDYTQFKLMRKESMIEEAGYPRLPRINRSIIVPDAGLVNYNLISSEYIEIDGVDIAPSKGNFARTIDPASVPFTFSEVYTEDEYFPAELVSLRDPHIVRDYRGAVLEINAFRYNPVKRVLRIYTDVTLEITASGASGVNEIVRAERPDRIDPQYAKIYNRRFINFSGLDYTPLLESGTMLVICYDSFMDAMQPFVDWKNQKGLSTEMVPISEVGNTTASIKNYIEDYYQNNDLVYVLLIGDSQQITTYSSGSDPLYALIEGNDSYPEIFIGRFSAEDRDEVETQVTRTITYEKFPDPEGQWYHHGLGDADESGPTNDEDYDFQHITHIAEKLVDWNYSQVDSVYTTFGGTTDQIVRFMNEGVTIFNYAGHGWVNMVGPVNFTSTQANQLINDNKLFHFVAVACEPGNFANHTCLAEDLMRATNDLTGEPTGSIANYLSKTSQTWFPPYYMQDEGVDLLVSESMLTFGGMCFNGSMYMIDAQGSGGEYEYKYWTVFGDPSVMLRSLTPYELTVSHNPYIIVNNGVLEVYVSAQGAQLEDIMVCGTYDEMYFSGLTDAQGHCTLQLDPAPQEPGIMTLTVTESNAVPYIVDVDIIQPGEAFPVYDEHFVQDDLTGNDNGQLDYGETVELEVTIENFGLEPALDIFAVISTEDELVTISRDSAYYGAIPAQTALNLSRAFEFSILPEIDDGHPVNFLLTTSDGIQSWESYFTVTGSAPDVIFDHYQVDDLAAGNGNGVLEPGETGDLIVAVLNDGSSDLLECGVDVSFSEPCLTLNSTTVNFTAIPAGEIREAVLNLTASPDCPQGLRVEFELTVSGALGYANADGFSLSVGDVTFYPSGPDEYGYSAYELNDPPEYTEYDWVELHPDSGGPGTQIPFVNDDEVLSFVLPFAFQYYGIGYDSVSVSSNGFIAMGAGAHDDYSNSAIPAADGPPAMIAPYWEDMSPQRANSGGVWYWYDSANHRYVIEFNHVEQFSPEDDFETFEVILYDPAVYQTFSGDGRIKFQYKEMSGSLLSAGTIGIENHAENDGIQFLFDGDLHETAAPILNGTAILFTTPLNAPEVQITLTPSGTPIIIPASGGAFDYEIDLVNNEVSTVVLDVWIDLLLPGGTVYGPLLLREDFEFGGGGIISRDMQQSIPANAPVGEYTYNGKIGNYPGLIYSQDSFPFEKSAADNGGMIVDNWELSGWDDQLALEMILPGNYRLRQNYPNPFNPETVIEFALPRTASVTLSIFNIAGQEVACLTEGRLNAGWHSLEWQAGDLPSGIYFCRLQTDNFQDVRKMMLLK